jgi:hypothetical protein
MLGFRTRSFHFHAILYSMDISSDSSDSSSCSSSDLEDIISELLTDDKPLWPLRILTFNDGMMLLANRVLTAY